MANWFDYALGWSASAVKFLPQVLQLVQLVEPSLLMFLVWVRWRRCRIVDHYNIDNSFGKLPAKWLLEHAPYAANHDVNLLIENLLLLNLGCRFYGPQPTQGGLARLPFWSSNAVASGLRDNNWEAALGWQPYSHAHIHVHAQAQAKCIWFIELWNCLTAIESRWAHRWSRPCSSSLESDSSSCSHPLKWICAKHWALI